MIITPVTTTKPRKLTTTWSIETEPDINAFSQDVTGTLATTKE
jgi:hypothetical protein